MPVFPNFFVCWHCKKAKQISRHTSHMNLFILIAKSITDDSEKGNDLFFWKSPLFRATYHNLLRYRPLLHDIIYSILAENLYKSQAAAHPQIFHRTQFGKHCFMPYLAIYQRSHNTENFCGFLMITLWRFLFLKLDLRRS